jgi:sugar phosphate isomerase/epimerase
MGKRTNDGLSRRDVLRWGTMAAAGAAAGASPWTIGRAAADDAGKLSKIPIALQLYSVRDDCQKDLEGTVKAVAGMGYQGVEFAGYYGRGADDLRKILDGNGLKCCGTHAQLNTLLGDALKSTIEFNKTIGNKFLIVPGLPAQYRKTIEAWKDTAKLFNELAEKVKGEGMFVGYHNHSVEFQPMEGQVPWDVFCGNTRKEVVTQLDTGNCIGGGGDPIALMKKYPGRALTVHLKEHGGNNAVVGEGDFNWKEFLPLCPSVGATEWFIVEQERYPKSPIESVKDCLVNLKKILKSLG